MDPESIYLELTRRLTALQNLADEMVLSGKPLDPRIAQMEQTLTDAMRVANDAVRSAILHRWPDRRRSREAGQLPMNPARSCDFAAALAVHNSQPDRNAFA